MRNIDASQWMGNPELQVVETTKGSGGGSSFTLIAEQVTMAQDNAPSAKGAMRKASRAAARGAPMNVLEELRSLDPRDPGRWPLPVLRGAVAARPSWCCAGVAVYFFVWNERAARAAAAPGARSRSCARSSRTSTRKAVNLDVYKQQLEDMERTFGAMLRQLPGKTEVPNLLVDISQTGLAAGLAGEAVPARSRRRATTSTRSCRSRSG